MPKIKNVSPFGDLDVPLLGRIFEAGTILDVTDEQAEVLLRQEDNFKPWGEPAQKVQNKVQKADAKLHETEEGVAPIAPPAEEVDSK
jgi:hypothetical protein